MNPERLPSTAHRGAWLLPVLLLAVACGGGSDSGDTAAAATGDPLTTYFSYRRINTATEPPFSDLPEFSSIQRGDKDFSRQFDVVANIFDGSHGGIALDYFGTMYAADIDADFQDNKTGVSINWSQRLRSDASETATFNLGYDRRIRGFFTGFSRPRNVAIAHAAGLLMVSDSGSADIKVFGTAATGNVPPLFTAAPPAPPWDLAYDDAADRLFASLTDGTIAVFDDFAAARPAAADRVIVPTVDGAAQATTSLRGIALVPGSMGDRLVFTDVGVLGAGVDGLVCAIEGAISADGLTATTILPANRSTLRDPVDVVATADGRLRVADEETNSLLILAATALDDPLPAGPVVELRRTIDRPSALTVEPVEPVRSVGEVGDLEDSAAPLAGLVVTTDPAGSNGMLLLLDERLALPSERAFDFGAPVRGVTVDSLGDAFVCSSQSGTGSIGVVNRFVTQRGTGADVSFDDSRDRLLQIFPGIFIPEPSLEDPIDVDVDETRDLVIVSDPGFPRIWAFGRTAGMNAESFRSADGGLVAGVALPGGLDYEATDDRLFLAVSNGTIYVYDDFIDSPGDLPDRVITPADSFGTVQISTSIRDVLYDGTNDVLFATDVGATSGASDDGAIYVFEGVSSAPGGLLAADRIITGAATGLDDPSDLAWNGKNLWVVDEANETISLFEDALALDGNVAPVATRVEADVRSVEVAPASVAPSAGGSILGG